MYTYVYTYMYIYIYRDLQTELVSEPNKGAKQNSRFQAVLLQQYSANLSIIQEL